LTTMSQGPPIEQPIAGTGSTPCLHPLEFAQVQKNLADKQVELKSEIDEHIKMSVHQPKSPQRNPAPVKPQWSLNELQILLFCFTLAAHLFS
jgi:hypothetical protein